MTTTTGVIPPVDVLKGAYGWQTECIKFVGEAGHKSVDDHFFSVTLNDLHETRASFSCCIASVPPKDQLEKSLPTLKKLNTVLILEELCDAKQLLNLLDFFAVHGVKATLLTSRLGINIAYPRADLIDVIQVLPYRFVDDLRDFFPIFENTEPYSSEHPIVNVVKRKNGDTTHLSSLMHAFKRDPLPIEANILIDEELLVNMFGFILLLRIFGFNISLDASNSDPRYE